jgi:hypothetical protein
LLSGLKTRIEGANVDAPAKRIVRPDDLLGRLDSFHVTELHELVKKKPIAATDIEDRFPSIRGLLAAKTLDDQFFARTKPPVILIELAIVLAEFGVQRKSLA